MFQLHCSLLTITIISSTFLYGMEDGVSQIQTLENDRIKVEVTEKRICVKADIFYFRDLRISINPTSADVQKFSPTINNYFDNKTHYTFDIPIINGPNIYVHGCSKDHAKLVKCIMGNPIQTSSCDSVCTLDIKDNTKNFFDSLWQQKEKEYSMALFRCFPGIYDKIYNYLPPHFVTIFHSGEELFSPKTARNTKAKWYLPQQLDPIKPSLKILLDALQTQGPDATYTIGTPEFLSKSLKRYNNPESLIALTAASHLLGDYKQDESAIPVDLTDYFGNAALDATEQSYGWIPGGREVTMTPVGKVRIHQRGLRGYVQQLFGYQTVKIIIDAHPPVQTKTMNNIKGLMVQHPSFSDLFYLVRRIDQTLKYCNKPIILIDKNKISRIIEGFIQPPPSDTRMQTQEIDIYDYKAGKALPTIALKTKHDPHAKWDIYAIGTVDAANFPNFIDTLEQKGGDRWHCEQQLCKYTKKNTDEWTRDAHIVQCPEERSSMFVLPRSAMAKEEILYATDSRTNTQKPYVRMYEPGFWRKLIYERRRTLLTENKPLVQTNHYRIFNVFNPLAWVRTFYATWME